MTKHWRPNGAAAGSNHKEKNKKKSTGQRIGGEIFLLEPRVMDDAAAAATAASAARFHHRAMAGRTSVTEAIGGSATKDAAKNKMTPRSEASSVNSASKTHPKTTGNTTSGAESSHVSA